jgi:PIN domain nuclease of toxin-antitoxin system
MRFGCQVVSIHEKDEVVEPLLNRAVMSSINWAEVLQRSIARGVQIEGTQADGSALGLLPTPYPPEISIRQLAAGLL